MLDKGSDGQYPELAYIAVAPRLQVPVGVFLKDLPVRVPLERLLLSRPHIYSDDSEAIMRLRPENGKENIRVNRLPALGPQLEILVLLYVFTFVPASVYTLFYSY